MDGFRRARTSYDFSDNRGGSTMFPGISTAANPDMNNDGMMSHRGDFPRAPSVQPMTPRLRSRPVSRGSGFEMSTQTDLPRLQVKESDNPYTGHMDPVNQQYYYRQWKQNPPSPRQPIYRSSRLGSPWRHVKACVNSGGNHIAFIDGTVKAEENYFYPPEVMFQPPDLSLYLTPRLTQPRKPKVSSTFNDRAKNGFQYWYKEPKPLDSYERERRYLFTKSMQRRP